MCKKLLLSGAVLALVGFLVFGASAVTRVRQGVSWIRNQVEEQVPVEYELDRARKMIDEIGPEVRDCRRKIAEKQVEIGYLDRDIAEIEARYEVARDKLEIQAAALKEEKATYCFLGETVSKTAMKRDAQRRFEKVKSAKVILESKRQRRTALTQAMDAAKETLSQLETQQTELQVKCDVLEAKMRETEARKATVLDIDIDSSRLAKAKDLLEQVQRRLDVELQVIENEHPLIGEATKVEVEDEDLGGAISAWLGRHETGEAGATAVTVGGGTVAVDR